MSKLDELIQELCPDGVEYKEIGEIFEKITDYTAAGSFADIAKNVKYNREREFAQLIRTTDLKTKFINEDTFVYVTEKAFNYLWRVNLDKESIIMPNVGNCGEVYFVKPEDLINNNNVLGPNAILLRTEKNNLKYLYYCIDSNSFKNKLLKITSSTGQTKFNKTNLKKLTLPVPPLEVQCEIVRILDKFTLLTAELTAELTVRRKQYEYYRKHLLEDKSEILKKIEKMILNIEVIETELIKNKQKQYEYYRDSLFKMLEQNKLNNNSSKDDTINEADLEELIQELYLNGGEYQKIEKFTYFEQPTKYIVKNTKYDESYETPVLTAGQTFILGYSNEKEGIYNASKESPVIIFDDFTGAFKWVDFPFKVKSSAMKIIKTKEDKVLLRFLYYKMGVLNFTSTEHKRLWINKYSQISISIPPLEVQTKIVNILDRFENLCNDISSSGLPAEIEARQKQYEYYRDLLLNFKEVDRDE